MKPKKLTAIVKQDQKGVFINHNGKTFRPDPHRLKRTPQNDMMYAVCQEANGSIGARALLLNYEAPEIGGLVDIQCGQDSLVIGAPMRVDQNSPYFVGCGIEIDVQIVTWSDETAPFRQCLN